MARRRKRRGARAGRSRVCGPFPRGGRRGAWVGAFPRGVTFTRGGTTGRVGGRSRRDVACNVSTGGGARYAVRVWKRRRAGVVVPAWETTGARGWKRSRAGDGGHVGVDVPACENDGARVETYPRRGRWGAFRNVPAWEMTGRGWKRSRRDVACNVSTGYGVTPTVCAGYGARVTGFRPHAARATPRAPRASRRVYFRCGFWWSFSQRAGLFWMYRRT